MTNIVTNQVQNSTPISNLLYGIVMLAVIGFVVYVFFIRKVK